MRIDGLWLRCDDGQERPTIRVGVRDGNGQLVYSHFLVDTAADRTMFDATFTVKLALPAQPPPPGLTVQGVGGQSPVVVLTTSIELQTTPGRIIQFAGQWTAFTDPQATDMSLLGRDVLNQLHVVVSRPRSEVILLGEHHDYTVTGP
jgi:hypothetical protein